MALSRISLAVVIALFPVVIGCQKRPPFDKLTLERLPCYGECPIYKVTVFGNGRVVYDGEDFIRVKGRVTDQLTERQVQQLWDAIEEANYFLLRDSYSKVADGCSMTITDCPSIITSVTVGKRKKSVHHYLGCLDGPKPKHHPTTPPKLNRPATLNDLLIEAPPELINPHPYPRRLMRLEVQIDSIIGTARWFKR